MGRDGLAIVAAAFGAALLLGGCDWADQAEGTHMPAFALEAESARLGFIPRTDGPNAPPEAALECVEPKEIGAPYPMRLWVRLGVFPGESLTRTADGGWAVGERFFPARMTLRIDRQRFEIGNGRMSLSPAGEVILTAEPPQETALFLAIARARMLALISGEAEERSLGVAVWRKELIALSEACERATLAWQFLQ
jgi:hypothetical protein